MNKMLNPTKINFCPKSLVDLSFFMNCVVKSRMSVCIQYTGYLLVKNSS